MKKVFLDANILIDFFDAKREQNAEAERLVYYLITHGFQILFSENILSTIIFVLRKEKDIVDTIIVDIYKVMSDSQIRICPFGDKVIRKACKHYLKHKGDFEDYLQYFCAKKEKCVAIYTMDKKFPQLQIPIKQYGDFDI